MRIRSKSHQNTISIHNKSRKKSCSLPLLPLSPLLASSSVEMLSPRRGFEHKLRSLSSMIHRRSRSSSIIPDTIQQIHQAKHSDERSTMSLCSVTSDEYDLDDTMTDSLDEYDDVVSTRDRRSTNIYPSSSQPTFPIFTRGNDASMGRAQESMVMITPPTPTRLTLKMRPSSFTLPFIENTLYTDYEGSDDQSHEEYFHPIDDMSRDDDLNVIDFSARSNDVPVTISTTTDNNSIAHGTLISESASYDENDENENIVPPPTTPPPFQYQNNTSTAQHPRLPTSPPMLRLRPKRIAYLPFHSHDNYTPDDSQNNSPSMDDGDDVRFTVSSFNQNLDHLLLPDDF